MRLSDAAELATMSRLCQPEPAQLMSSLNQFRQAVAWICFLKFKLERILESVLGIRDIFVPIQIRIQLRIRLLSSVTFRMQKKIFFFFIFFSYNLPVPAGTLSSAIKSNFLLNICVKILFCKHYFSPLNNYMKRIRIGEAKHPDPDPQHCLE